MTGTTALALPQRAEAGKIHGFLEHVRQMFKLELVSFPREAH
jgi:hypothetical protein